MSTVRFPIASAPPKYDPATQLACPPCYDPDGNPLRDQTQRLGWLTEAVQQGRRYLEQQRAWPDMDVAIDIIAGITNEVIHPKLSNVTVNLIKRDCREIIEVLSDIRQFYGVQSDNADFYNNVEIDNKLSRAWAQGIGIDRHLKSALQYAHVLGTGYLRPHWVPDYHHKGRGEIALDTFGARDVLPIHIPRNHDLQAAHAVICCISMPLLEVQFRWPQWADKIQPSFASSWGTPASATGGGNRTWFNSIASFITGEKDKGKEVELTPWPTVEVYVCYILDHTVNQSNHIIPMGTPGSSWEYHVPSFDASNPEASYLYPLRRLMIATKDVVLEDGSAHDWHGMVPLVKLSLDEWAWDYLGYSIVRDTAPAQRALNSLRRGVNDSINVTLQPPYTYDKNAVSPTDAATFNPRIPGNHMMADHRAGIEPIRFPVPKGQNDVPQFIPQYIQYLEQLQHHVTGVADVRSMSQASQLPSSDTLEKLLEMAGPLVRGMSRSIEFPLTQIGEMNIANFTQYYSMNRRINMLGMDGVTREDFDLDSGSMVPAGEGSRMQRGRVFLSNFFYQITPGSLHTIKQSTTKLLYMQLVQRGMPIDPETLMAAFDVPNWGKLEGNSVLDKWITWQKIVRDLGLQTASMQGMLQLLLAQAAQNQSPEGQMQGAMAGIGQALSGLTGIVNGGQPAQPEGRPNAFSEMPHLETKGDGRSTVSTS